MTPFSILPREALEILKECHGKCGTPQKSCHCKGYDAHVQQPLASGQTPIAAILSCSDSRVVPEHIFGAPPGALFVVRTAGNVVDTNAIASIEFAVNHLKVPLVVVMGHEDCGAVKAACQVTNHPAPKLTPSLYKLLAEISPVVQGQSCCPDNLPKMVQDNARYAANALRSQAQFNREPLILPVYFKFGAPGTGEACGEVVWLGEAEGQGEE